MSQFDTLRAGQILCWLIAGALAAVTYSEHGFVASAVPSFALIAILAALGWLGPQIIHELAEINDQLAGRSKELHAFLRQLSKAVDQTYPK